MTVRDILQRFRPAGAPGSAAAAGVPVDRAAEVTAELGPVFNLLAEVEAEAEAIRLAGAARARARRSTAAGSAERILADAHQRAEATRAAAAAAVRAELSLAVADTAAAAGQEVDGIRAMVAARLPGYVTRAVDRALAGLDGAGGPT